MMRNQHHFCMDVKEEKNGKVWCLFFIVYQVTRPIPAKIWVNITRIIN